MTRKNLHPGGRKFVFANRLSGDILFSPLASFAFFCILIFFFACLVFFFEIKNMYSDTHSTVRSSE